MFAFSAVLMLAFSAMLVIYGVPVPALLLALGYGLAVVFIPGFIVSRFLLKEAPDFDRLSIPLATVLGLFLVVVSYLAAMLSGWTALNFAFLVAYLLLLLPRFWTGAKLPALAGTRDHVLPVCLVILVLGYLVFMMRPTPGLVPIDVFQDHLWSASNTVALSQQFPLHSLNIETRPPLSYHVLIHMLGAHLSMVSGLTPHLTGLQFVFVPLVILLVVNVAAALSIAVNGRTGYVAYGLAVVFFGGGFAYLHEVKVNSLINSATNLIGVLVLFAWLTVQLAAQHRSAVFRLFFALVAVFLATVAKGSMGAAIVGGTVLWFAYLTYKRQSTLPDGLEMAGAAAGFLISYAVFFNALTVGSENVPPARELLEGKSMAITPLAYVTQNSLSADLDFYIDRHLSGWAALAAHVALTTVVLPIHVLFYYSYRLLPFIRWFGPVSFAAAERKVLFVAVAAMLTAYLVEGSSQVHAYFLSPALYILDLLFVSWVCRRQLFPGPRGCATQEPFARLGIVIVLILPFLTVGGWLKQQYFLNFFATGHVGVVLEGMFESSSYREQNSTITPALYEALSYIRTGTPASTVVVTPFIDLQDGRPLSFYTSTFAERAAFLEGYGFAVARVVSACEIARRRGLVEQLYVKREIPSELRSDRFVILAGADRGSDGAAWHDAEIRFRNREWMVLAPRFD